MEYVAGLLYSDNGLRVSLILKNRPVWQAGFYNAIGGKIEPGETPLEAMKREFIEEAGVDISWNPRFSLQGPEFTVHFFSCHDSEAMNHLRTCTDEVVDVFEVGRLPENMIPNLRWIIPMLNDFSILEQPIKVVA